MIFCAGTGIYPFLDLFDLLLRKTICDVIADKAGSALAQPLYPYCKAALGTIASDFRVTLYASFDQDEDYIAKDILEPLTDISNNYQLNLFSCYLSYSNTASDQSPIGGNVRYNQDFISNYLDMTAERVYVCGPPKFNHEIPAFNKKLKYDPKKIYLV